VRAAVVRKLPTDTLDVADVAEPRPEAPDELLVAVDACGICGTDLHILEGRSYRPELPFVLGHEPVGRVVATGAAATEWLDRRVTITLFTGCGTCALCRSGDERLCPDLVSITGVLDAWGGFAERLLVRAAQAVEVPDALSSVQAATLVDAGATAVNAVRVALGHGGEGHVVVGGGPVGFLSAERLRAAGRAALVVEPQPGRRTALERLGHETSPTLAEASLIPDAVLDCSGAPEAPAWALDRLAPRGLYVSVGYARAPDLDLAPVARKELTIRGVRSGTRADLLESLELAASGTIRLPAVTTWGVEEINDAFDVLRRGALEGKAVIDLGDRKESQPSTS
jgi:2-desacetyl-2-hydroxyethyl bacteriochlorophyllide A dehydrogenase